MILNPLIRKNRFGWVSVSTGAVVLCGCASLDPTHDIQQASLLVADRVNADPGWAFPWNESSEAWDGRSPLSSDAAVRVALQNNREIRKQVESIVATRADYVQSHLLPNPVISVMLGYPTDGLAGEPFAVAVAQQFAWLWKRPAAIDSAEAELEAQVLSVSDAALQLVSRVRTAHARVAFTGHALDLQRENTELLKRTVRLIKEQLAVGEASRIDLNRIETQLHNAEIELINRRQDFNSAKRQLLQLLGRSDGDVTWSVSHDPRHNEHYMAEIDESYAIQLATTQRLDVFAAVARAESQAADIRFEKGDRLPDVKAGVGFQREFSDRRGVFPAVEFTPKLFDDNSARLSRAESEWRQALIESDQVLQSAITEARQAWIEYEALEKIRQSFEHDILALAENDFLLAQHAFDAGEFDLIALLNAEQQLNVTRIEFTDRQFSAASSYFELERSVGGTLNTLTSQDEATP